MIDEITIEGWNGERVHLELSSPQPEGYEIKTLLPGWSMYRSYRRAGQHRDRPARSKTPLTHWGGILPDYSGGVSV